MKVVSKHLTNGAWSTVAVVLVKECRASGMTAKAWCEAKGIQRNLILHVQCFLRRFFKTTIFYALIKL